MRVIVARLDTAYAMIGERDSVIKQQSRVIERQDSVLRVADRKAAAETKVAVTTLAETLTEQQKTQLTVIVKGYESQLAYRDSMMVNSAKLLLMAQGQIAQRDTVLGQYKIQLGDLQKKFEKAEHAGRPSTMNRVFNIIGKVVTVGGVLYGVARVIH